MRNIGNVFGVDSVDRLDYWQAVLNYMNPIIDLYLDPDVSEIMINKYNHILVQTSKGQILTNAKFESEAILNRFVTQVASALNQKFTEMNPVLHARFPDDSRLCCVHQSVSPRGVNVTIRIARSEGGVITPEKMIENGYMTDEMWQYLVNAYSSGKNIIFSGNTGSGKTSMMRNLLTSLGHQERILIVEDTNEINIDHDNVINMEAANKKNASVTLEELIQTTLRQFGSKLVVGEIRDAKSANALIQAINTGVTGCTGSLHANNARSAVVRLQYLLSTLGYVRFELAGNLILSSIDIFVHCDRSAPTGRRVKEICVVNEQRTELNDLFTFDDLKLEHQKM
ncbi:ATPase, T2SS/T4P/T4SS family [Pseudoalteromonas nigrifaciens]|uniref:ATPase, T2SS/T4P/T4SS family n=1 Tax=Pseudoalteromonas nigrifaciens TaxID=28109 RepID=UPI003FD518B2